MKFVHLLERYSSTINIDGFPVEIFVYPSPKDIKDISSDSYSNAIRFGATDEKKPKLYAWGGGWLHDTIKDKLKFDFGFYYEPNMRASSILADKSYTRKNWDKYKHKDELIALIKRSIPTIKYKNFYPDKGFREL